MYSPFTKALSTAINIGINFFRRSTDGYELAEKKLSPKLNKKNTIKANILVIVSSLVHLHI